MMRMQSDGGIVHLASIRWRKLILESKIDYHHPAQTTLTIGEGGLSRKQSQGGDAPRWFKVQLALLLLPIEPAVQSLNHVTVF
jgi:hypothetical protein